MWSLTFERKEELLKKRDNKIAELQTLEKKTPKDLWREDLDAFLAKLEEFEAKQNEEAVKAEKVRTTATLTDGFLASSASRLLFSGCESRRSSSVL